MEHLLIKQQEYSKVLHELDSKLAVLQSDLKKLEINELRIKDEIKRMAEDRDRVLGALGVINELFLLKNEVKKEEDEK